MTVLEIVNKIKHIETIQDSLRLIADRQQTSSSDEDKLNNAIDALDGYIQELMHKEVKEKNV